MHVKWWCPGQAFCSRLSSTMKGVNTCCAIKAFKLHPSKYRVFQGGGTRRLFAFEGVFWSHRIVMACWAIGFIESLHILVLFILHSTKMYCAVYIAAQGSDYIRFQEPARGEINQMWKTFRQNDYVTWDITLVMFPTWKSVIRKSQKDGQWFHFTVQCQAGLAMFCLNIGLRPSTDWQLRLSSYYDWPKITRV